jgi:hypothetical protein
MHSSYNEEKNKPAVLRISGDIVECVFKKRAKNANLARDVNPRSKQNRETQQMKR